MLENVAKNQLLERIKTLFDDSIIYDREWQINAQEAFGFRDGYAQWKEDEKDILENERRPALTLNVVKSHIDLIMGLNEDIKKKYICSPVGTEDGFLCEVLNNIIFWLYQKNSWESEEDNAYESALISGRGWVHIDFDIDENRMDEIKITETSIPIHEVRMDSAARKRDLSDASHIFWERWLHIEDFAIKYPKFEQKAREAFEWNTWPRYSNYDGLVELEAGSMGNDINDESDYSDPLDVQYFDAKKKQIRVCHMEYWKYTKKYFVYDPGSGQLQPVEGDWKEFQKKWKIAFPNKKLRYETSTIKEVWWLQFCGEEILYHGKSPISYPGFSIIPCFVFDDVSRRKGSHYGVVELMKDPQREINKRVSQSLNLFNQQVQPGVYAEPRAFINEDQAEQSLKEAGSVTYLQDGAIGQKRFMERTVPTFPSALLQMGEYAREMLRHITGINPDLLGMNDKRQEPGIVVQLRQQQGMAILKPVFKAYSSMKKELFERQVRIVLEHMPISQIAKILGENNRYIINKNTITDNITELSAVFDNTSNLCYDVDAEPETASLSQNALELATFMEMQKNGIMVDPRVLVGKTNIPTSEKLQWIQYIEGQQKAQSEAAQAEMDLKKAEIEGKNQIELKKIELQLIIAKRKADDQQEKDLLKIAMDEEKLKVQAKRDKQSAALKTAQIMSQANIASKKIQIEWVDMLLDADIDRKRLILDTAEIMAMSRNANTAVGLKAITEMYREALKANTLNKVEEKKLAVKVMETLAQIGGEKDRAKTQLLSDSIKARTDVAKQTIQSGTNEKIASEQNASTEKVADRQARAQEITASKQADAAKETAKATIASAKETGKAQVQSAKAITKNKKKNKLL